MNEIKNNDLSKVVKLCYVFRLFGNSNAIHGSVDFETNNTYVRELQLGKENNDEYEITFFHLDIKIRDGYV